METRFSQDRYQDTTYHRYIAYLPIIAQQIRHEIEEVNQVYVVNTLRHQQPETIKMK